MTTIDLSFIRKNPLQLLIGFLLFYCLIAQPLFDMDLLKSLLLFALLCFLYKKYGNNALDRFKKQSSLFGKRRRR